MSLQLEFTGAGWLENSEGVHLTLALKPNFRAAAKQSSARRCRTAPARTTRRCSNGTAPAAWTQTPTFGCCATNWPRKTRIPKRTFTGALSGKSAATARRSVCWTRQWTKLRRGWEHNGLGWVTEILPSKIAGCVNVVLYYGSSTSRQRPDGPLD